MMQIYSMHLTIKIINATMRYKTADKLYTPVKCCNLPRHWGWLQQCLGIIATYTVTKKSCSNKRRQTDSVLVQKDIQRQEVIRVRFLLTITFTGFVAWKIGFADGLYPKMTNSMSLALNTSASS